MSSFDLLPSINLMVLYTGWPFLHYLTYRIVWIGRIVQLGTEERPRRPRLSRGRLRNLTRTCSVSESGAFSEVFIHRLSWSTKTARC